MSREDSTQTWVQEGGGPLLLEISGPAGRFDVPLPDAGALVIGRSRSCAVRIDHASVSREHARVQVVAGGITVEDLGSRNGTLVHGALLPPGRAAQIGLGDTVEVGAAQVRLARAAPAPPPRRKWTHGYFEGRVEEECARARRGDGRFAVLRVSLDPAAPTGVAEEVLSATLRAHDVVASYAAGELEALLADATAEQAEAVCARLGERLRARQVAARTALACFPRDGTAAGELLHHVNRQLSGRGEGDDPYGWSSASEPMRQVLALIEQVAPSGVSVLILGETGVGKEVAAERIHRRSPRAPRTFLRLNCAALPDALIESELFGYEKGAFTGAAAAKPGLIESADGGTVFLDEIGELPMATQVKLLRVLDAREVQRLGGLSPRKVDVRFVAATNRSLEAEIGAGRFRQDLYFRLAGVIVRIPPLRERVGEIVPLARRFVGETAAAASRPAPELTAAACAALERYAWPGNIRELRNAMERAVILCGPGGIEPAHLPLEKFGSMPAPAPRAVFVPPEPGEFDQADVTAPVSRPGLRDEVEALEKKRVLEMLTSCGGNQSEAARRLGMSRGALLARLKAWGVLGKKS
jgi:DNA-binding NtrC family response regulator